MTARAPRSTPALPETLGRVHIIGICGTAMAALAGMLQSRGIEVTGSDAMAYPPVSDLLEQMSIPIRMGYRAEHVDDGPDLVVVGNVCRRENPEAQRVMELGIPYVSLPEILRLVFLEHKTGLVVTGTHGKTTTSSLVAWLLEAAGREPSYLIGGVPANFGSNYRLGSGDLFVVEGDEYDTAFFDKVPKFWHYPAKVAVINNIEYDHADIYPSIDDVQAVFDRFAAQVDDGGALWINGDDPRCVAAARHARARVRRFGLDSDVDLTATAVRYDAEGTRFRLVVDGVDRGELISPLWGEHNLRNAMGATAICMEVGVDLDRVREALPRFKGIAKRQEQKGVARGVTVIDDFAHHPTAVRETLRAVRERFPDRRIWAVFEAKSNTSRRAVFQHDYPPAFAAADRVVLSAVWKKDDLPESEKISIPQMVRDIRADGKVVEEIAGVDDIVDFLDRELRQDDVVVGLSGSDFGGLHGKLLDRLS